MKHAQHLLAVLFVIAASLVAGCHTVPVPDGVRHDETKPVRNDGGGY